MGMGQSRDGHENGRFYSPAFQSNVATFDTRSPFDLPAMPPLGRWTRRGLRRTIRRYVPWACCHMKGHQTSLVPFFVLIFRVNPSPIFGAPAYAYSTL